MKISVIINCLLILLIAIPAQVTGSPGNPENSVELRSDEKFNTEEFNKFKQQLKEKMKKTETVSFGFLQNSYIADSTRTVKSEIKFKRPEKLFIKYTEPSPQNIIFSSNTLITYVPSIKQATRQNRKSISGILGTSASLIISDTPFKDLEQNFDLTGFKISSATAVIRAVPRGKHNFEKMNIYINQSSYLPIRTVVSGDNFKSITEFKDYRINLELKDSVFTFDRKDEEINIINID
ncbi:MAG: LolA family protein [Elusimicrobiota bacterium]